MANYAHLGSALTLWPVSLEAGLHIVAGVNRVAHEIIDLCLTKKGDDPLHCGNRADPRANYGIAVDLFDSESDLKVAYFRYSIQKEITRWIDLEEVWVESQLLANPYNWVRQELALITNALEVQVNFVPRGYSTASQLTFPWFTYRGEALSSAPGPFLDAIALNGEPFRHFAF